MSVQTPLRERAVALVTGAAGTSPHAMPAGHLTMARAPLERVELSATEHACEVGFKSSRALGGYNNPFDGRNLSTHELVVRVAYVVTPGAGDFQSFETQGGDDGASDPRAVEDRGETDAVLLREVLGWQGNWTGLTPSVIDCAPHPEGDPDPVTDGSRVIRETRFLMTTGAASPSGAGPAA